MQTLWHRTGDEAWLRLTRFFGTLYLINFAIGVATGLVQEFQFGMNWSVYSKFVGNVFGAPLAIEGLAAFMLEATFLGLWVFGWNRLSPRVHLATLWIAVAGSWASGYFILVANSWMQHPVGYKIVDGEAQLTSVWALLSNSFALRAYLHTMLAGLIFGSMRDAGSFLLALPAPPRGRPLPAGGEAGADRRGAGHAPPADRRQPVRGGRHERAGHEDRRLRGTVEHVRALRLLGVPDRGLHRGATRRRASRSRSRDSSRTWPPGSFSGEVQGLNDLQAQEQSQYGSGNYIPNVRVIYWSMRVMAMLGVLMFMIAAVGAWLYWKRKLERARWFQWTAIVAIAFPYIAATAGWVLTEMGRQPWIVQGLLKTEDAHSPNVGTAWIAVSLGFFIGLYLVLGVLDFVLMRRYARPDRPPPAEEMPAPAVTY